MWHSFVTGHTRLFLWKVGTSHRRNGFYTVQCTNCIFYWPTPNLHMNLPLTENFLQFYFLKKTNSIWFISLLGTWGNVLINHLLLLIPISYPCHYTNLCPHISQERAHTHTHTHTHTHIPVWPSKWGPGKLTCSVRTTISAIARS